MARDRRPRRRGWRTDPLGGDYHGKNPAIQNASRTFVGPDAAPLADAMDPGDGGTHDRVAGQDHTVLRLLALKTGALAVTAPTFEIGKVDAADAVSTGAKAFTLITLKDGTTLTLRAKTVFTLDKFRYDAGKSRRYSSW